MNALHGLLLKYADTYHSVLPFKKGVNELLKLDFTVANAHLAPEILSDTGAFSAYINELLGDKYLYGIGGYAEHRTIYSRSPHFDGTEPRRLHLGIDVWGKAGTPIFAPLGGYVHSFAYNNRFGDYGATIILHHQLDGISFNTLYGHLSQADLTGLQEGNYISRGVEFAHFGEPKENGYWPPHLHFQVVQNMFENKGDYPGVCAYSKREEYLENCPDPDAILQLMQFAH